MKKLSVFVLAILTLLGGIFGTNVEKARAGTPYAYKLTAYNSKGQKVDVKVPANIVVKPANVSNWFKADFKYTSYKKVGKKWVKVNMKSVILIPSKWVKADVKRTTIAGNRWEAIDAFPSLPVYLNVTEATRTEMVDGQLIAYFDRQAPIYNSPTENDFLYAEDQNGNKIIAKNRIEVTGLVQNGFIKIPVGSTNIVYTDFDLKPYTTVNTTFTYKTKISTEAYIKS